MSEQEKGLVTEQEKHYPKGWAVKCAGGTMTAALLVDLFGHLGPTGLFVGGLASYVAYRHGPEIMDALRSKMEVVGAELPTPPEWLIKSLRKPADPIEALPECVDAEGYLHLANDLIVPAGDIAGKAVFIAGVRRSGKTTLGVRLAEQMSKLDQPLFVPDLEGDWISAATSTFKNGHVFAHPSAERSYRDCGFEAVTKENAEDAGFGILVNGYQAVLDMASYPSIDEACTVVVGIIKGLFLWSERFPEDRVLCHVYLDEAQRFLPQTLTDSIIEDKNILQALLKAYMNVIAVGGKRGLSPVILTQRFAQVNKKIMAQSEVFFLLRQTNEGDLARCMEYVSKKTADEETISKFVAGQGIYIAATGEQRITRFLPRASDGKRGATPTVEAAQRRYAASRRVRPAPKEEIEMPEASFTDEDLDIDDIYGSGLAINTKRPVNGLTYTTVNGLRGQNEDLLSEDDLRLPVKEKAPDFERSNAESTAVSVRVSEEIREIIRRLVDANVMTHDQIAKAVKLDGRKYPIYRQVCSEMGISTAKKGS